MHGFILTCHTVEKVLQLVSVERAGRVWWWFQPACLLEKNAVIVLEHKSSLHYMQRIRL